jgi:hypothetical protein
MRNTLILTLVLLFNVSGHAARVNKVSKDKRSVLITQDGNRPWSKGDIACVYQNGQEVVCGTVAKASSSGAIVKLDAPTRGLLTGDSVRAPFQSRRTASIGDNPKFGIGLSGGLNLSNQTTADVTSTTTTRSGISIGSYFEIPINKNFILQPELNYLQKGYVSTSSTTITTVKMDYLSIPLQMKIRFPLGVIAPFFMVGPYINFLMSGKQDDAIGTAAATTTDIKDQLSSVEIGSYGGTGLDFFFTPGFGATLLFRYGLGFSNINNTTTTTTTTRLRGVEILSGVKFSF